MLSLCAKAQLQHHTPPPPPCQENQAQLLCTAETPWDSTRSQGLSAAVQQYGYGTNPPSAKDVAWDAGISTGELWPGQPAAALRMQGGKPSGFRSSQLGQAFQGSQAPTDFHFVFFKTDQVAVIFPMTFSCFNLHPMQTPQTFSTGTSQGQSFFSLQHLGETDEVMQKGFDYF